MINEKSSSFVGLFFTVLLALCMVMPAANIGAGENESGRDYIFVQFNENPTPSMLAEVKALGGVMHQYYQDNTYLVEMDLAIVDDVQALSSVSNMETLKPEQKLDKDLAGASGIIRLRVTLHDGADVKEMTSRLEELGVEIELVHDNAFGYIRGYADASLINGISQIKEVAWLQEVGEAQALMDQIRSNPYQGQVTPQTFGYRGSNILAMVQDSGIDDTHPDLAQVTYRHGPYVLERHGTCVSGIMFGNGAGDPTALGMLYEATGVFCDWQNGNYQSIDDLWNKNNFVPPANPLVPPGVVQTNSWWNGATMDGEYDDMSNEIDRAAVDFPYVLNHWACGNSNHGTQKGVMSAESISKNDISGGAIFHEDTADMSDDHHTVGSTGSTPSRGPSADGRVKPDLCGPFDWIHTVDIMGAGGYSGGDYYDDFGGTSGATPTIAGSSGLTYDMYVDNFFGNNPFHSWPYSSTVKALMIADAQQYPIGVNGIDRDVEGWGAPDLQNMYNLGPDNHVIEEYPQALNAGDSWNKSVFVDGTNPLKISLVWIDPAAPSSTGTGRALINNLDLKVTSPVGTIYWGNNGLDNNTWSTGGVGDNRWSIPAYGSYKDDRNNVENVFVQNPFSGLWTVEVLGRGGDLPQGPQDFSLVAAGAKNGFAPTVDLTVPDGGENWKVGEFHDITWSMSDFEDPAEDLMVTLDLSTDGGGTYPYNIIFEQTGFSATDSYNWQIPNYATPNAKVRITVEDIMAMTATDESAAVFIISQDDPVVDVLSPDGGESLMGGGSWSITWTAIGGTNPLAVDPISIDYSTNGPGGPWNPLASNEPNDGNYLWDPIPLLDVSNCYVRVTAEDTMGFTGDDISASSFDIDSTAPAPAANPRAELDGTGVRIYWDPSPSPDIGHYEVFWGMNVWDTSGDAYATSLNAGLNTDVLHANVGINNANSYVYQVRTFDRAGHETRTTTQAAKYGSTQAVLAREPDWFLLGSPLVQSDTSVGHVIQGFLLPANADCMRSYDGNTGNWLINIPTAPGSINTLTDINTNQGFWMHVTGNSRFATAGYVEDKSITLYDGWNLVAYPFAQRTMTTANIMTHLAANCPNYDGMLIEDLSTPAPYHIKTPAGTESISHNMGFWVHVTGDTTWTVINY